MLATNLDGGLCLPPEAGDRLGIGQRLGQQEFDGDAFVELEVRGGHHHAHPARAEHAIDPVLAPEYLACINLAHLVVPYQSSAYLVPQTASTRAGRGGRYGAETRVELARC